MFVERKKTWGLVWKEERQEEGKPRRESFEINLVGKIHLSGSGSWRKLR